jgi:Cyclopropane fatty acid synthase and related methyltransferases
MRPDGASRRAAIIAATRTLARRVRDRLRRTLSPPLGGGSKNKPAIAGDVPPEDGYQQRIAAERQNFDACVEVHALPPIFHYWSNRYLRPRLEAVGVSDPDAFFTKYVAECYGRGVDTRRFVSIGAGNCDTEVRLARALINGGCNDFVIECLELNDSMLERGRQLALAEGLADNVVPLQADFNEWQPVGRYDGIIAHQSLHHVIALEHLFDAVGASLAPHGRFIVSDMIGRNGHQRWPEALVIVRKFWRELPSAYHYNHQLKRQEDEFLDWDCSTEGFEGIRAQDILPLLVDRFGFDMFLGFANVIDPFIDRGFGPNFSADRPSDREFIDRVHERDQAEIAAGSIKPTHMFAVMRCGADPGGIGATAAARAAIRWPD